MKSGALVVMISLSLLGSAASAAPDATPSGSAPVVLAQATENETENETEAEKEQDEFPSIENFELPEASRETIQEFVDMISPFINRLGALIDDLPMYGAPEVLPNGDILIPRLNKQPPLRDPLERDETDGTTKT